MDRDESHAKLLTPLCEGKDYYNSDSSPPSLKQALQSDTKPESSKTIIMLVMTIGINNLEEEMTTMKDMLESSLRKVKKRRHASGCRKKRLSC